MLAEGDIAIDQRGFHRRKVGGSQIFFAKESVNGNGGDGGKEHALGVDPADWDRRRDRGGKR